MVVAVGWVPPAEFYALSRAQKRRLAAVYRRVQQKR